MTLISSWGISSMGFVLSAMVYFATQSLDKAACNVKFYVLILVYRHRSIEAIYTDLLSDNIFCADACQRSTNESLPKS
jgi:hypothetical protein